MTAILSFAHDFEAKNADGETIYCNITLSSDFTVAVTYQGTYSDARHAVGDFDWCQTATAIEHFIADGRHAVGNGDGGQAATPTKCKIANFRHAVGDIDGC